MKNKLWVLLKTQYLNQSSFNAYRQEKDRKKKRRQLGIYVGMALVFTMLVVYSFIIAYGYGYLGMQAAIPGYSLAISSIITLFFTFVKTNGFLFAFKDYDMIMALPVSTKTVITAKFLYMYINNLIFSLCVMIPMCAGYAIWAKPGIAVYLIWFVITCFAPLIPMAIASALGALIAAIGSKSRFKVFVQVALSMGFITMVFGLQFLLNGAGSDAEFYRRIKNLGEILQTQIHRIYPIAKLFDGAVEKGNLLSGLGFVAISLLIYFGFVILVSVKYKAVNTALMTSASRSNYKVGKMKEQSIMKTIIQKEMRRFTASAVYLMNMGIGMMLAVIGCILCLFVGVDKMLSTLELERMQQGFYYAIPFVLATILTMTNTTSVSWSLEGKNLWIIKSMPIEEGTIFKGKMVFNVLLLIPACVICNICLIVTFKVDVVTAILYVLVSFATVAFSTTFGMILGKKFPNFEWENEIEVIKRGMAPMISIFGNMILEIIFVVAAFGLSLLMDGRIVLGIIAALLYGVSGLLYRRIVA